ncbi:uncharacterized protein [Nicotiana sylvestris]|uniref:uncharacterized protein n=1 Tax=Nicotiana sylvestris TaxID=4096 RepID=UPI00388CDEBA
MTTIFHDMIHKEIEVYVDDVIIKSKKAIDHREDMRKFFNRLRMYNLKLNPAKCAFGAPAGKLLRFIVSRRGIELDPSKILKKDAAAKWTDDCQRAFDRIKDYLSTLPVLAIKGQALADHLAENPVDGEYEPLKTYFLDEKISSIGEDIAESYDGWRMFFDGAANFKGVREEWATKNTKILPYLHHVRELRKRFTKTEFQHVPKVQNEFADALATLSSMIQHPDKNFIDPIPVKIHDRPAYCAHVEEEADEKPWFYDIKEYLTI